MRPLLLGGVCILPMRCLRLLMLSKSPGRCGIGGPYQGRGWMTSRQPGGKQCVNEQPRQESVRLKRSTHAVRLRAKTGHRRPRTSGGSPKPHRMTKFTMVTRARCAENSEHGAAIARRRHALVGSTILRRLLDEAADHPAHRQALHQDREHHHTIGQRQYQVACGSRRQGQGQGD